MTVFENLPPRVCLQDEPLSSTHLIITFVNAPFFSFFEAALASLKERRAITLFQKPWTLIRVHGISFSS